MARQQAYPSIAALRKLEASLHADLREQDACAHDAGTHDASATEDEPDASRLRCLKRFHWRLRLLPRGRHFRKFLLVSGALEVARQGASERMRELMEQYRDRPMDLADASLVVLAEELDGPPIVSFDSDFRIYRLRGGAPVTVVP